MKRGTPSHPKMLHLMALLDIGNAQACGSLELMWHFTAAYATDGGIGRHPDHVIARACDWQQDASVFIGAMVEARWLDTMESCRLFVHGWDEHCDNYVNNALAKAGKFFANGARPKLGNLPIRVREEIAEQFGDDWRGASPSGTPTNAPSKPASRKTRKTPKPAKPKVEWDSSAGFSNISDDMLRAWKSAYPQCDVESEIKRAHAWLVGNPEQKYSSYGRFLAGWFGRSNPKSAGPITVNGKHEPGVVVCAAADDDDPRLAEVFGGGEK